MSKTKLQYAKVFSENQLINFIDKTEKLLVKKFGKKNVKKILPRHDWRYSETWKFEVTNSIGMQRTLQMEFDQRTYSIYRIKDNEFNEVRLRGAYDHEKYCITKRRVTVTNPDRFDKAIEEIVKSIVIDFEISSKNNVTSKFELECIKIAEQIGFKFNPESGSIYGTIRTKNIVVESDEGNHIELNIDSMKMKDILPILKAIKKVLEK